MGNQLLREGGGGSGADGHGEGDAAIVVVVPLAEDEGRLWSLLHSSSDGEQIAIFEYRRENSTSAAAKRAIDNGLQRLKRLRHPSLLRFQWEQRDGAILSVVTERVTPLASVLSDLEPSEVCLGLRDVITCLAFLHKTCELSHNNLSLDSLFVAADHSWRLGGLEFASSHDAASLQFLEETSSLRSSKEVPTKKDVGRVDIIAFADLLDELQEKCPALESDSAFKSYASHYRNTWLRSAVRDYFDRNVRKSKQAVICRLTRHPPFIQSTEGFAEQIQHPYFA
eukprot:m.148725 g.148725  ORF g.148725 m.148725 type:complete len:282 (-) comp16838_c2_seq4:287-1132(-)